MTALFRSIGAGFSTFDGASKVSGFLVSAFIMYTGYMIQKPAMHPVSPELERIYYDHWLTYMQWFVWIYCMYISTPKPQRTELYAAAQRLICSENFKSS
jgi:hypothetical protein